MTDNFHDITPSQYEKMKNQRKAEIGKRIREERKKLAMTQENLAEKLTNLLGGGPDSEISQSTICAWENGKGLPPMEKLLALSAIFHCDCGYLLCDYNEKTHDSLEMCREIGLSEASINYLKSLKQWGIERDVAQIIDFLLYDERARQPKHHYRSVLDLLAFFFAYQDKQKVQKQVFTSGLVVDYIDNDGTISTNAIRINERIIENAVLNEIQQALISLKKDYVKSGRKRGK